MDSLNLLHEFLLPRLQRRHAWRHRDIAYLRGKLAPWHDDGIEVWGPLEHKADLNLPVCMGAVYYIICIYMYMNERPSELNSTALGVLTSIDVHVYSQHIVVALCWYVPILVRMSV